MKKRNILLTIEYDGTCFHGWQRQPNLRTAQGTLEEALSRLMGHEVTVIGVSRTDAGVHALGQRACFICDTPIPDDRIALAVNNIISAGDMRITRAEERPIKFHPRKDAAGKKYRYVIFNSADMPVFLRNYSFKVGTDLDIESMREAAERIEGRHDFACFQASGGTPGDSTVRIVKSIKIEKIDPNIHVDIIGDGFLYNMVRIITGTLVEVGLGKRSAIEVDRIIESGDRSKAGFTAPPQGLYLMEVFYGQIE